MAHVRGGTIMSNRVSGRDTSASGFDWKVRGRRFGVSSRAVSPLYLVIMQSVDEHNRRDLRKDRRRSK